MKRLTDDTMPRGRAAPPARTLFKENQSTPRPSEQLLLLFLKFSVLVPNPEKLLYTVANPDRGLLTREKIIKEKVWQRGKK